MLSRITPAQLPWVSLYWIFAAVAVTMVIVLAISRFPSVQHTAAERPGTVTIYKGLIRRRLVWLYFFAIFTYVGCEQGTANWISQFLSHYHGYDPHSTGARAVSWFWGLMTAGCFAGALLLRIFDSRRVLISGATGALLMLSLALYAPAPVSLIAFPLVGLFASVMWPILISLALNSVAEHHGSFTGILTTGIMGGAIVTAIIGRIGDHLGLRTAMALLYLTFGYVWRVGFWAKPLINNATIKSNDSPIVA
jgi:fucose permease